MGRRIRAEPVHAGPGESPELDDPRLFNDAYELFSDPKRTPREKIRAMEFRLESFKAQFSPARPER